MSPKCPICNKKSLLKWSSPITANAYFSSSSYSIASSAKQYLPIFECINCRHNFTYPMPSKANLLKFYQQAPNDQSFIQEETGRRKTAQSVVKKIRNIIPNGKTLIDLGCGPGLFLSEAQKEGFNTSGIEASDWAYTFSTKTLTLPNIIRGDLNSALKLPPQSFDVVTSFDLIEHLANPKLLVQTVKHLLKPDGLFVLTTPRIDCFTAKVSGKKWHALFPEHLHYFSLASLDSLLSSHNLSITKHSSHTRHFSLNYLLTRLLHRPVSISSFPFKSIIPINFADELEIYATLQ